MKLLLPQHEIFRIDGDARGLVVRCKKGMLWLTQPGDHTDHILNQGDQITVDRKGCIAIMALDDSHFDFADTESSFHASLFNLSLGSKFMQNTRPGLPTSGLMDQECPAG
ncbi:MAG: DUF2917 domain-containing protein [Desulfobacteraceae bacterium]|nr:DUF2917 domain-containing protein [Desulfobacteraceae bacterium]